MQKNLIPLAVNVSRVYEIAETGGHHVKLIATETISNNDLEAIKTFYSFGSPSDPDIVCEVAFCADDIINAATNNSRFETLEQVDERIRLAKASNIEVDLTLDKPSISLLKSAIDKLSIDYCDTVKIIRVAATIAKLEGSSKIQVVHLAEAIQYKSVPLEFRN
jgi:hypothetical protein